MKSKELVKNLMCVSIRNGVEVWIDEEKMDKILALLEKKGFFKIGKEIINSVDVSGVFSPQTMADYSNKRNGRWKCNNGEWHDRFEKCDCDVEIPNYAKGKNK